MRQVPQGIHQNDLEPLREMLGVAKPHALPASTLGIYQRVYRYKGALTSATLANVPGALLLVAWNVEEVEAARLGCSPDEFSENYNAEQKAIADKAKAEIDARNKAAVEAMKPAPKKPEPVGAK